MFGIGPTELIVILVIALLVLGPKKLPELAQSVGRALGEFRRATADITSELDDARSAIEDEAKETVRAVERAAAPAQSSASDEGAGSQEAAAPDTPPAGPAGTAPRTKEPDA